MVKVLVVEDEASIRELIALNLQMAGWEVLEAENGERGLRRLKEEGPCDAAVLDVMLPGIDGFSLCESIRRDDQNIGSSSSAPRAWRRIRSGGFPSARTTT